MGVRLSDRDGVVLPAALPAGVRAPAADVGRDADEAALAFGAGTANPDAEAAAELATLRGVAIEEGVAAAAAAAADGPAALKEADRLTEALRAVEVFRAAAPAAAGLAEVGVLMVEARCKVGLAGDADTELPVKFLARSRSCQNTEQMM
jgi:uncharacterized membrane-anchored protein